MNEVLKCAVSGAVERIPVPAFNFAAIAKRPARASRASRSSKLRWLPLLVLGVPAVAVGGGVLPSPQLRAAIARVFHFQKGVAVTWTYSAPTTQANALSSATFHITLPSGLPAGTRLTKVFDNGSSGTSYAAEYALPNGKRVSFTLEKRRAHEKYLPWLFSIPTDSAGHVTGQPQKVALRIWLTGDEVVSVAADAMSATQLERVERSMHGHDAPLMIPK